MALLSFVIMGIIRLVLANTMIMSAEKRTHEFAVLKSLGVRGRHIFALIAGESLLLSALGSITGIIITFPAVEGFQGAIPKGWFPIFYIEPQTVITGCLAGLFVGLTASLIPARCAVASRIVEGLRYVGGSWCDYDDSDSVHL